MIGFEIDIEPTLERVVAMDDRIKSFAVSYVRPELEVWQTEDMRRKYPNVEIESLSAVFTLIWPRSRTYGQRHPKSLEARTQTFRRVSSPQHKGASETSTRSILRPELLKRLVGRMDVLMGEKISWSSLHGD